MPKPTSVPIPQKALDAVANAHHAVELPQFDLPRVPDHPSPENVIDLLPADLPEHPADQALEHASAPTLQALDLPEQAAVDFDTPPAHLPDFLFDLA